MHRTLTACRRLTRFSYNTLPRSCAGGLYIRPRRTATHRPTVLSPSYPFLFLIHISFQRIHHDVMLINVISSLSRNLSVRSTRPTGRYPKLHQLSIACRTRSSHVQLRTGSCTCDRLAVPQVHIRPDEEENGRSHLGYGVGQEYSVGNGVSKLGDSGWNVGSVCVGTVSLISWE